MQLTVTPADKKAWSNRDGGDKLQKFDCWDIIEMPDPDSFIYAIKAAWSPSLVLKIWRYIMKSVH